MDRLVWDGRAFRDSGNRPSIGSEELHPAPFLEFHRESAFMDRSVVSTADEKKIIELGFTPVRTVGDVVGIGVAAHAPRKPAALVPVLQRAAYGGGHGPSFSPYIKDIPFCVVGHGDD